MAHFLRKSKQMSCDCGKLASIEKSTPPMGEPKATATPAALAAVKISRILAGSRNCISTFNLSMPSF